MPAGRDQVAAMSRLARIIAVLDNAGRVGASADDLMAAAGYTATGAPQDQLSADLRLLRRQGWTIDRISADGAPGRYRMETRDNRLQLALTDAQRSALHRAMILADRGDLARRLGVEAASLPDSVGVHTRVVPHEAGEALARCLQAVRARSLMRFSYKGSERQVHPGAVRFQNYRWYLSGIEQDGEVVKHFVVDRMSQVRLEPPGTAAEVPELRRIPLHPLRWEVDAPVEITLRTAREFEPDVERWLMRPLNRGETGDHVDMTYRVTHRAAFRARVYVLGSRVRILSPDSVREELLHELREMAGLA
ncbi:hypothetical protein GCM10022215_42570 [Nocardioides fonticola]|uniref:WYL domain-containing protein n=2 Tax=Nocardioides fonticola TaxID=450363 RepID=A0ABP7Y4U2_9ACTN